MKERGAEETGSQLQDISRGEETRHHHQSQVGPVRLVVPVVVTVATVNVGKMVPVKKQGWKSSSGG